MELNEFLDLKDYTLSIDWSSIENDIGFQLHDEFEDKDFLVPTGILAYNIDEFLNKLSVNIS